MMSGWKNKKTWKLHMEGSMRLRDERNKNIKRKKLHNSKWSTWSSYGHGRKGFVYWCPLRNLDIRSLELNTGPGWKMKNHTSNTERDFQIFKEILEDISGFLCSWILQSLLRINTNFRLILVQEIQNILLERGCIWELV